MPRAWSRRNVACRAFEKIRPLRTSSRRASPVAGGRPTLEHASHRPLSGNIIYVGLVTLAQKRLDWMLGYSSVMHMGYIFPRDRERKFPRLNGATV